MNKINHLAEDMSRIEIRAAGLDDCPQLVRLLDILEFENDFMVRDAKDNVSYHGQLENLQSIINSPRKTIFVADYRGQIIGYYVCAAQSLHRTMHVATTAQGVLKQYRGLGVGSRLESAIETWAANNGISRLTGYIDTKNTAAFDFYKKRGWVVEGIMKKARFVNNEYRDLYFVAKFIEPSQ